MRRGVRFQVSGRNVLLTSMLRILKPETRNLVSQISRFVSLPFLKPVPIRSRHMGLLVFPETRHLTPEIS